MKPRIIFSLTLCLVLLAAAIGPSQAQGPEAQAPMGTAFTYQGQLRQSGAPVDGTCDFQFDLWNAASAGTQIGSTLTQTGVAVTRGLFTVLLDFGASPFQGEARYLESAVRCPTGSGSYTTLSPRQALTPVPYALYAATAPWTGLIGIPAGFADGADNDTTYTAGGGLGLAGGQFSVLGSYRLPQSCGNGQVPKWDGAAWACAADNDTTYTAGAGLSLTGKQFSVNFAGTGSANTAARSDHSHPAGAYWSLTGNAGTNPTTNFVGTTDAVSLTLAVSGTAALRLAPAESSLGYSPKVVGGHPSNSATAAGATIGGGGVEAQEHQGGTTWWTYSPNEVTDEFGTIGGGLSNKVWGYAATIGGGEDNLASGDYSTIGGGGYTSRQGNFGNKAMGTGATVAGGIANTAGADFAAVGGGTVNFADGSESTIAGGKYNTATEMSDTIGGGSWNEASGGWSTISGGWFNEASGPSATVGGGHLNTASGEAATVPGGENNTAEGDFSFAAGRQAKALHNGSFVWADSGFAWADPEGEDFASTVDNEFAVRARGGVRVSAGSGISMSVWDGIWSLKPMTDSVNIVGGNSGNAVSEGVQGATIAGGGAFWLLYGDEDFFAYPNKVGGDFGSVGGGLSNEANGYASTVSGGEYNHADGDYSTVSGGGGPFDPRGWIFMPNTALGKASTVSGGQGNFAAGGHSTIGGGNCNVVAGTSGTVAGGGEGCDQFHGIFYGNVVVGDYGAIGGGRGNVVTGTHGTVAGGFNNIASDDYTSIGGGGNNQAGDNAGTTEDRPYATVAGGKGNLASHSYTTVGGGLGNKAQFQYAAVGGGLSNTASGDGSVVAGGVGNRAQGLNATVAGGNDNKADAEISTVGGGRNNNASSHGTTIGGGWKNTASASLATVSGGTNNTASQVGASVGGGSGNTASQQYATIGGGYLNTASVSFATISGGNFNTASQNGASVGGGNSNTASGTYATVPGGYMSTAQGNYSFAAGRKAKANNEGCFVWGDSTNAEIACNTNNAWVARTTGGVYFYTNAALTSGVRVLSGASAWSSVSDRNLKENFAVADGQDVLERLSKVPITTWNYKAQDASIRHMGPVAQDFYASFGLGEDETLISTIDADGVALAAIQGLYERSQTLQAENTALRQQVSDLESRMAALEALVTKMAQNGAGGGQ